MSDTKLRSSTRVLFDYNGEPPYCEHGPMLLFERYSELDKRFFACSANRDRKLCSAYVLEANWAKFKGIKSNVPPNSTFLRNFSAELHQLRETFLKDSKRKSFMYCHSCEKLVLDSRKHTGHTTTTDINNDLFNNPSKLLKPMDNSKREAQYFFTENSKNVIVQMLQDAKVSHCLCIACPSVFEKLKIHGSIKPLMLDLDLRYSQFFDPKEFLQYNMFNHYFFDGLNATSLYEQFLKDGKTGLAVVIDPPFGGKVEVISHTIKAINNDYKRVNGNNAAQVSSYWVFPYFMEHQIQQELPNFAMLDYKVEYVNHKEFQNGASGRKQGSPVRIFTNVDLRTLRLPKEEGYRFCKTCERWTSIENKHCMDCNSCTSKDGRTYVHCHICKKCVKPTWVHCKRCKRCALTDHPCSIFQELSQHAPKITKLNSNIHSLNAKSTSNNWKVEYTLV